MILRRANGSIRFEFDDAVDEGLSFGIPILEVRCQSYVLGSARSSTRQSNEVNIAASAAGGIYWLLRAAQDVMATLQRQGLAISWADLVQLAGAVAVQEAGGPFINIVLGRT